MRLHTLVLSSLSLALPTLAHASTIYTYTGNNYTFVYNSPGIAGAPFTESESLQGSFTVNTPLAANLKNSDVNVSTFSFSDGQFTFTNGNVVYLDLSVTTDSAGNIIGDDIESRAEVGDVEYDFHTIFGQFDVVETYIPIPVGSYPESRAESVTAGVWTSTAPLPAGDPAIAAAPEPSSLILLGTGCLATLGALRRRLRR